MKFPPFIPSCLLATAIFLLAGCVSPTPYQRIGISSAGGYSTQKLADRRYQVLFQGNENTAPERAYDLALLRAAELTLESGHTHFVVIKINNKTKTSSHYRTGRSASITKEQRTVNTASGRTGTVDVPRYSSTQGQYIRELIPAFEIIIEMLDEKTVVQGSESHTHDARQTADSLRKQYRIPI